MLGTAIGWCDDTLNFWWGCLKVSPACKFCYADSVSKRYGYNIWGPPETTKRRVVKSALSTLNKIRREARKTDARRRVFVQSMSDFFEDMGGFHPEIEQLRDRACSVMEQSTELDFLLLTKRPENIIRFVPEKWLENWPQHILVGASAENQDELEKRLYYLLKVPARRFLSCEPLLGNLNFNAALAAALGVDVPGFPNKLDMSDVIHWIIAGGESGLSRGIRPMQLEHVRAVRDWCKEYNVPFFFKQWGRYVPILGTGINPVPSSTLGYVALNGKSYRLHKLETVKTHLYADFLGDKDHHTLDGLEHQEFYNDVFRVAMFHDISEAHK